MHLCILYLQVDVGVYRIGDVGGVNSDRGEVSKMQKGHGDNDHIYGTNICIALSFILWF